MSSSGTNASAPGTPSSTTPTTTSPTIERKKRGSGLIIGIVVVVVVIILIIGLGYAAGWFKTASSSNNKPSTCTLPTAGTLKGEGSTLVEPLIDQWATSYWTGSIVTYDAAGSSSGVSAITLKVIDFGASDFPLNSTQLAAASGILTLPDAAGGVVPIYNLPGITSLNFNGSVLAQLFDGQLTNWNNTALQALNPGVTLPDQTVAPIYRTGGSGTSFIFTQFLSAENAYWKSNYGTNPYWPTGLPGTGASGNGGEADAVATTTYAIGYVDLNYALSSGSSVGIGSVENPSGHFIRASVENTESALLDSKVTLPAGDQSWYNVSFLNAPGASDYPITSLTYLLIYENLSKAYSSYTLNQAENLVDFLKWAITTGQSWSAPLYYAPLPASVVAVDNATIASMTFGGSTVPVCVPTGGAAP